MGAQNAAVVKYMQSFDLSLSWSLDGLIDFGVLSFQCNLPVAV